jgi:hypothetical protein
LIAAVPSDAEENDSWLEVTPLEGEFILLHKYDS